MNRLYTILIQCAIVLLCSYAVQAKGEVVHVSVHSPFVTEASHHATAPSFGSMYEVGKYPGRHKLYMHKKLVLPVFAMVGAPMWVLQPQAPEFTSYYFSSFYRSHINAILNSNDLLRGPPVRIV